MKSLHSIEVVLFSDVGKKGGIGGGELVPFERPFLVQPPHAIVAGGS